MAGRVSTATRSELAAAIGARHRASSRAEKGQILDEFVAVTGYHRKHAIRLLRPKHADSGQRDRRVERRYGTAVREGLIALREASDRLCSRRLKPMLPVLDPGPVAGFGAARPAHVSDELRALPLAISPASIDRLLSEVRVVARGGRRRRAGAQLGRPAGGAGTHIRGLKNPPGFVEAGFVKVDFVAHSGPSAAGSFVQTMVLTDIATG